MSQLLEIAPGRFLHAGGAMWLGNLETALIADVHLGYAWAQRRRGELAPPVEGGVRERLALLIEDLRPRELVVVGDLVHAPTPDGRERQAIVEIIASLSARTAVTLVPGNHDRGFARDFAGLLRMVDRWHAPGYTAIHGHTRLPDGGDHLILGHLHPALGVFDDAGAYQKVPVFVAGSRGTVLPAFSPFAAGVPVGQAVTPEVRRLLGSGLTLVAATGKRAIRVPKPPSRKPA